MNVFHNAVIEEEGYLRRLLAEAKKSAAHAPNGKLHVSAKQGKWYSYYQYMDEQKEHYPSGKYIRKKDLEKARKLAQKEYDAEMIEMLERKLRRIERFKELDGKDSLSDIYQNLAEGRKCLVHPYTYEPELSAKEWEEEPYEQNPFFPEKKMFETEKGELVRSKSEKIIADKYAKEGIPYRYEAKLRLNGRSVFPDFTLLQRSTGKMIYHEHLGMLGDPEYTNENVRKIDSYIKNGIVPGKNLIITAETADRPFDPSVLDPWIRELKL